MWIVYEGLTWTTSGFIEMVTASSQNSGAKGSPNTSSTWTTCEISSGWVPNQWLYIPVHEYLYPLHDSKISRHDDMLWLPFEAIKVLPHTLILKNRRLYEGLQCWEHVLMYFWPKGLHIIWSKEKSCSRNGAFKETSRPCANLQWPIGPWTSAKWLHSRSGCRLAADV